MNGLKTLALITVLGALHGCTVLGFATDLAILTAADRNQKSGEPMHTDNTELFFTNEGLKHDVKVVKKLVEEFAASDNDFTADFQENDGAKVLACNNVRDGKQRCFMPEYYQDMYITESDPEEANTSTTQD
ncbi:hypothetical protein [uncultured Paraglaciecola sp.]|uniref:hypothetical protein n=1 Tax=uncultured Paraglaciecola sp. TaxID=1765024 RepID=UPI0030DD4CF6|tara:strand:+ start:43513 stop:43905 length:393 start_codon:yes stop_codon:yes gene_type:complete